MVESTTPSGAISSSLDVIDIIDISDDECDISNNVLPDRQGSRNVSLVTCFAGENGKDLDNNPAQNDENSDFCEDILFDAITKRKRTRNVVMSESESDHDTDDEEDDVNNSLTTANLDEEVDKVNDIRMPRQHGLKRLKKIGSKNQDDETILGRCDKVKYQQSIPTIDVEEDSLYSEEGNLNDFIVDVSDCEDMSNKSRDAESNLSGSQDLLQDNNKDSYLEDVSDRKGSGNISLSNCSAAEKGNIDSNNDQFSEENSDKGEDFLSVVVRKKKQARNVVISESENDDDQPIRKLLRKHVKEISVDELENIVDDANDGGGGHDDDGDDDDMPISQVKRMDEASKRGPKRLRKCLNKSHDDKTSSCLPTNDDAHDDDDESTEELSMSEEGNLKGFIVDDIVDDIVDEASNCEVTSSKSQDGCNGDADSNSNNSQDSQDRSKDSDSQDVSDEDMNFSKILSKIQRKKKHEIKWEFEADMLAELGKDPVLCMKAVCALYRQQTDDEQAIKGTLHRNGRGFNCHDADRGSDLADFLTDGNPYDDINKTVEELEEFDPEGVEVCRSLALRYSKQLYEIFENKEDPFFP